MCGICGVYYFSGKHVELQEIVEMRDVMSHRGPDDEGMYIRNNLGLGHRRLSIIDLSSGARQPMANEDKSIWLIFNGEIYNYVELAHELKSKGHIFRSRSDTEIILHAYEEYQEQCNNFFNGMWAFAIWDSKKKHLFCSRDRFGIKPFYYYLDKDRFVFASEIKSILKAISWNTQPNETKIFEFLAFSTLDTDDATMFKGIKQLPAGHFLSIKCDKVEIRQYWSLNQKEEWYRELSDHQVAHELKSLFEDSVRVRLRSDVPVASLLSGGIDSTSIVCIVSRLLGAESGKNNHETFSASYDDSRWDETEFIDTAVKFSGVRNTKIIVKSLDIPETLNQIIWFHDEPFVLGSTFVEFLIFREIKKYGAKVVLNGQGADEIFAGYNRFKGPFLTSLLKALELERFAAEFIGYYKKDGLLSTLIPLSTAFIPRQFKRKLKFLLPKGPISYLSNDFFHSYYPGAIKSQPNFKHGDPFSSQLYHSVVTEPLPPILHREDRNSMAFSIELRVPFLDYRFVEYVFSLPSKQKIRQGMTKYAFRNAMKGILPERIRLRPDKIGFETPLDRWIRGDAREFFGDLIHSQSFKRRGYFNTDQIRKNFKAHLNGKDFAENLWRCVNTEIWLRLFFP
ncbi:MAG: asparagine synthase (glutamine-hydrolyzing) [Candidatus Hodarchaeota archaeon]